MAELQEQMEGLPGYDILMGFYEEYAEEHFNTKDPFEDENGNRRKVSKEFNTKKEEKLWKKVQLSAWSHDKCFMGSCGVGMDCGLGLSTLAVFFFPVLGPIIMYGVHARLIHIVTNEMKLPGKLVAKMEANIFLDLLITFPPIIGAFFGYLHACSTRNAGLIYSYFEFLAQQRQTNKVPNYVGRGAIGTGPEESPFLYPTNRGYENPAAPKKKFGRRVPQELIVVQNQQQSGYV